MCPEIAKTGSPDTLLAFFIRIWEGSMALRASWEVFRVLDEPPIPFSLPDPLVVGLMRYLDLYCCNHYGYRIYIFMCRQKQER